MFPAFIVKDLFYERADLGIRIKSLEWSLPWMLDRSVGSPFPEFWARDSLKGVPMKGAGILADFTLRSNFPARFC